MKSLNATLKFTINMWAVAYVPVCAPLSFIYTSWEPLIIGGTVLWVLGLMVFVLKNVVKEQPKDL